MAILETLGLGHLAEAFRQPGGIHQVWNLVSLEPNLRTKFDRLNLWFENTGQVRNSETYKSHRLTTCAAKPL